MKDLYKISAILLIFIGFIFSCQKIITYSDIPQIKFKSFTLKDTVDAIDNIIKLGELVFSFIDGDGDLGLEQPDSIQQNDTIIVNLFFTLFEKIDGQFQKVDEEDLETPLNYRIPYMEREGQNKTLKGEIQVNFEYYIIEYDTIKYEFYIVDRALHKSNVETTPEIIFN